jgi:hypothetical protein
MVSYSTFLIWKILTFFFPQKFKKLVKFVTTKKERKLYQIFWLKNDKICWKKKLQKNIQIGQYRMKK